MAKKTSCKQPDATNVVSLNFGPNASEPAVMVPLHKGPLPRSPSNVTCTRAIEPSPGVIEAVRLYNEMAERTGLPAMVKMTPLREKNISRRLAQHGLDGWREAMEVIKASSFLQGRNDRGWKPDLDWLTVPGNAEKFQRLIDGGYGGGKKERNGPLWTESINDLPPCERRPKLEKRQPSRLDIVEARLDAIERRIDSIEAAVSEILYRLPPAGAA
jgi:hypothetical protein